jgi:hypothetical protein
VARRASLVVARAAAARERGERASKVAVEWSRDVRSPPTLKPRGSSDGPSGTNYAVATCAKCRAPLPSTWCSARQKPRSSSTRISRWAVQGARPDGADRGAVGELGAEFAGRLHRQGECRGSAAEPVCSLRGRREDWTLGWPLHVAAPPINSLSRGTQSRGLSRRVTTRSDCSRTSPAYTVEPGRSPTPPVKASPTGLRASLRRPGLARSAGTARWS